MPPPSVENGPSRPPALFPALTHPKAAEGPMIYLFFFLSSSLPPVTPGGDRCGMGFGNIPWLLRGA